MPRPNYKPNWGADMTQDLQLREQLQESDLELSPAMLPYTERLVNLATARSNEHQPDWRGEFLYVQELKGHLQIRLNNQDAPLLTLREGDRIRADMAGAYLTNEANAAWGTARIVFGFGEFVYVAEAPGRAPAVVYPATGESGALALSTTEGRRFKLVMATVHFDTAPAADEDVTLTLNARDGSEYDTVLARATPADESATDVVMTPDEDWIFEAGDELDLAFANTDNRTYGARIVVAPA